MRRNRPQYAFHISHYSQILKSSLQPIKSGSHLKPNTFATTSQNCYFFSFSQTFPPHLFQPFIQDNPVCLNTMGFSCHYSTSWARDNFYPHIYHIRVINIMELKHHLGACICNNILLLWADSWMKPPLTSGTITTKSWKTP